MLGDCPFSRRHIRSKRTWTNHLTSTLYILKHATFGTNLKLIQYWQHHGINCSNRSRARVTSSQNYYKMLMTLVLQKRSSNSTTTNLSSLTTETTLTRSNSNHCVDSGIPINEFCTQLASEGWDSKALSASGMRCVCSHRRCLWHLGNGDSQNQLGSPKKIQLQIVHKFASTYETIKSNTR